MTSVPEHITVCICTFKRPEMLTRLLEELQGQKTEGLFTYSIVVVDNDERESARQTVESFKTKGGISTQYYVESEQNIALARNKAVQNAHGDYVAFIDDDEFPLKEWLFYLHWAINRYNADGILAPVLPHYEAEPPKWIIKGRLLERECFRSGTILKKPEHTRSGNALLARRVFTQFDKPFDPSYGRTGGEDVDFFRRSIEQGRVFVWCSEACVYETVTTDRLHRIFFIRRALLRGVVNSRRSTLISLSSMKSIVACLVYTACLPFLLLIGQHMFMRYLIKDCDHLGKLLGILRIRVVSARS
jgi:succinoglycan biosynthesis protein ExoM